MAEQTSPNEVLKSFSTKDLLTELQRRAADLGEQEIAALNEAVQLAIKKDLSQTASTTGTIIEDTTPVTGVEVEAKRWVEIIRSKGRGEMTTPGVKGWSVNGIPIEELVDRGVVGHGQVILGHFGRSIDLYGMWWSTNSSQGKQNAYNLFIVHPWQGQKEIEFDYTMPHGETPGDPRPGDARFLFYLPEEVGEQFSQAVKASPDLIEGTFQTMYRGLTGQDQLRRYQKGELNLIEVSNTNTYQQQIQKQSLPFSRPVGEIKV